MQILGLLALLGDAYFGFVIGVVMSRQDPITGIILLSVAIATRIAFIIEEVFVTNFNWISYTLVIPVCFINVAGVILGECMEFAIVTTTFTGVLLLLIPPAVKVLK